MAVLAQPNSYSTTVLRRHGTEVIDPPVRRGPQYHESGGTSRTGHGSRSAVPIAAGK